MRFKFTGLLNNKMKKWALFATFFFFLLSFGDYSVLTFHIPPFQELRVTDGILGIKRITGGKGASDGDIIYIKNSQQFVKIRCRINSSDESSCIPTTDRRFYDKKFIGDSIFGKTFSVKPNTSQKIKYAKAWWFKASYFGPLSENRLMQLDVEGERIIDYDTQKTKYMLKKRKHFYSTTILLVFSIIWFFVLQVKSQSLNIKREK